MDTKRDTILTGNRVRPVFFLKLIFTHPGGAQVLIAGKRKKKQVEYLHIRELSNVFLRSFFIIFLPY